jgi:hypothetical protein
VAYDARSLPRHCQRCGNQKPLCVTMSRFNTDMICPDCENKERAHPDYQKAADAELAQVKMGNMNFRGIGKPADL